MPLFRIDVTDTIDAGRRRALADALHQAAVTALGIAPDNRHQIIAVHRTEHVVFDSHFAGLDRGEEQVVVQVTLRDGRSTQAKRDFYAQAAKLIEAQAGVDPGGLFISLVETGRADWSFGDGQAQLLDV
jgi:phenylpyruvate tautomerase PptA (4-oxalocrotonate tautomerase family)